MKKLIIDRKAWLHGEGGKLSYLLRTRDNKKCCIGLYLESVGVKPVDMADVKGPLGLNCILPGEAVWLFDSAVTSPLMDINDKNELDPRRELKIKTLFAAQGIRVTFI